MTPSQAKKNKRQFLNALKESIESQMSYYPERFADSLRNDKKYPKKFADHIWQKLVDRKVFVINDTVAEAMQDLGEESSIENIYEFLGIMPPTGVAPTKKVDQKKETKSSPKKRKYVPFHGC